MKAADPIDTARLSFALTDLRLPAIKLVSPDFAARSDKELRRPHAFWPRSPSTRWPNRPVAGSSVVSTKPACHPARRSTVSSSMRCP